jgi:hypothetical protein
LIRVFPYLYLYLLLLLPPYPAPPAIPVSNLTSLLPYHVPGLLKSRNNEKKASYLLSSSLGCPG